MSQENTNGINAGIEWISGAELARRAGVARSRITAYYNNGLIPRNDAKQYDAEKCLTIIKGNRALDKNGHANGVGNGNGHADDEDVKEGLYNARLEAERYKALLLQLEYEQAIKKLLPADEVEAFATQIVLLTKTRFLNMSAKLAPILTNQKNPKKVEEIIDREVAAVLKELSKIREIVNQL